MSQFPTPAQLTYFQWSTPTNSRPTLDVEITAATVDETNATVTFSAAPKDEDGTIITTPFLFGIKVKSGPNVGYTMLCYAPNGADGASGLSATGCKLGVDLAGLDYTTGNAANVVDCPTGSELFCAIDSITKTGLVSAVQGAIGTGGNDLKIGDNTDTDKTIYAYNGDANNPFIQYDSATNQWLISNDGTSTFVPGTGAGAITGGDGITVTAGDIDIDPTDTTIFVSTSSGAGDAGKVMALEGDGYMDLEFLGAGATVTTTALATITGGAGSDADAFHTHGGLGNYNYTAYEAISAGDAVCLLPIEVEYYTGMTDTDIALGDDNARRRYAIKITPTEVTSFTTMTIRGKENGSSTLTLTVSIQTDNSGEPSGTVVTNGTANTIDTSTWTTSYANRTVTWGTAPTLSAGTTYWLVFEVNATNGSNYAILGTNANYDENYLTFERLTYDLDSGTWGNSATNSTPFFFFSASNLGHAIAQTDASAGGRTWTFIGFAPSAISEGATGSVASDYLTSSGLTPGADYYLSATPGEIGVDAPDYGNTATSVSTYTYKVAKALSTTDLKVETGKKMVILGDTWTSADDDVTHYYYFWFKPLYMTIYSESATVTNVQMGIATSTSFQKYYDPAVPDGGSDYFYLRPGGTETDPRATLASVLDVGFSATTTLLGSFGGTITPQFIIEG